jgi:hypothetical protein
MRFGDSYVDFSLDEFPLGSAMALEQALRTGEGLEETMKVVIPCE